MKTYVRTKELADYFNVYHPKINFADLQILDVNDNIIREAAAYLFHDDSNKCRYLITKVLKRNTGNIKQMLINNITERTCNYKHVVSTTNRLRVTLLQGAITALRIKHNDLCHSYYRKGSIFGSLCSELQLQNSLNNRKRVHHFCRKNYEKFVFTSMTPIQLGRTSTPKTVMNSAELNFSVSKSDLFEEKLHDDSNECGNTSNSNNLLSNRVSTENRDDISTCAKNTEITPDLEDVPNLFKTIDELPKAQELLPIGTRNINVERNLTSTYKNCKYNEGNFILSPVEFNQICQNKKLVKGRYSLIINGRIKTVNNTCCLYFKHSRYIKAIDCIKMYAYCAHSQCKLFVLFLNSVSALNEKHTVEVFSTGKHFSHVDLVSTQVRGISRQIMRNDLLYNKPFEQRQNDILQLEYVVAYEM